LKKIEQGIKVVVISKINRFPAPESGAYSRLIHNQKEEPESTKNGGGIWA
jgi:hypothetical protein